MPEVTVILPVYNGMKFLEESIHSVLKQSFPDFHFLICDDSSTDKSWEYIQNLQDKRVSAFRNEKNKGLFPTMNFLCKQANTRLIKLWSQDDIMNVDCLKETVAFHDKYPGISFSYSDTEVIDENGKEVIRKFIDYTPDYIPRQLHDKIALYTGSIAGNIANVTIVKSKLEEVGYFNESMIIAGDFDMWVKLTAKYDIGRIARPLIKLRNHTGQLSRSSEFYLRHLKEEKEVFFTLFQRVDDSVKAFGRKNLKWIKHPLYFSFMIKTCRMKKWNTAKEFYNELQQNDNLLLLSFRWLLIKVKKSFKLKERQDNSFLFQ